MSNRARIPHGRITTEVGKINKFHRNYTNQQLPSYYGEVEFSEGEIWTFITEIDEISEGNEYILTYEFSDEILTEIAIVIREAERV